MMEIQSHLGSLLFWNAHSTEAVLVAFSAVSSVTNAPDLRSLHSELLGIVSISNVPTQWRIPEVPSISQIALTQFILAAVTVECT